MLAIMAIMAFFGKWPLWQNMLWSAYSWPNGESIEKTSNLQITCPKIKLIFAFGKIICPKLVLLASHIYSVRNTLPNYKNSVHTMYAIVIFGNLDFNLKSLVAPLPSPGFCLNWWLLIMMVTQLYISLIGVNFKLDIQACSQECF